MLTRLQIGYTVQYSHLYIMFVHLSSARRCCAQQYAYAAAASTPMRRACQGPSYLAWPWLTIVIILVTVHVYLLLWLTGLSCCNINALSC